MSTDTGRLQTQNMQLDLQASRFSVELTYFRCTDKPGKYAGHGKYWTNQKNLWEIWQEVQTMLTARRLPGLIPNHNPYYVLVVVAEHAFAHPHLIIPVEFTLTSDENS